jgi:hypothetical protein
MTKENKPFNFGDRRIDFAVRIVHVIESFFYALLESASSILAKNII